MRCVGDRPSVIGPTSIININSRVICLIFGNSEAQNRTISQRTEAMFLKVPRLENFKHPIQKKDPFLHIRQRFGLDVREPATHEQIFKRTKRQKSRWQNRLRTVRTHYQRSQRGAAHYLQYLRDLQKAPTSKSRFSNFTS